MTRSAHTRGQSVVETLIALGLLVVGIGAASILVFGGQGILTDRGNTLEARALAREGIDAAKAILKSGWAGVGDGTYGITFSNGTWQFGGSEDTQSVFTRRVTVTTTATDQRTVKSKVEWAPSPSRTLNVELVGLVTNWEAVQESGGDGGGSGPSGNWQNPQTLGSVDLGPGNQATDLDVKNKIVYMSADASSASKPDFYIINATDGQNPFIVSSLNTGNGLNGVDAAGNYAYVVGEDDAKEFQVIDVSNLSAPSVIATLNLSGNADGFTVFYFDGYAYVGRASGAPQEFLIINVSNPASPNVSSGLTNVGDEINDIYVLNTRAYLGTEDNAESMIVVDVASSTAPSVLGSMNTGAHVYSIYVQSESRVTVGGKTKLFMADVSAPSNILTLGSSTIGEKTRDVVTVSPYAFLGTEDSNKEFQVWNISNPATPTFWSSFNFPQVATGVDYEDNLVYVSVRSNDALRIITSSP